MARIVACTAAALALGATLTFAAGSKKVETPPAAAPPSPEHEAITAYNEGLAQRDAAWKLAGKLAAAADDAEREKLQRKIGQAYQAAIREFRRAVERNPKLHEAHASLGYAHRQTGDYTQALAAYDRALALAPDYVEAIEYRGEAYLGLGRLDDAKAAWEALQARRSPLALDLLGAMRDWIGARRRTPGTVDVGALDALERWIDERRGGHALPATSSLHKGGW